MTPVAQVFRFKWISDSDVRDEKYTLSTHRKNGGLKSSATFEEGYDCCSGDLQVATKNTVTLRREPFDSSINSGLRTGTGRLLLFALILEEESRL